MVKRYRDKLSFKTNVLLFVVLTLTVIEILLMSEDLSLAIYLMLSMTAILTIIALDVNRILNLVERGKVDGVQENAVQQEQTDDKRD